MGENLSVCRPHYPIHNWEIISSSRPYLGAVVPYLSSQAQRMARPTTPDRSTCSMHCAQQFPRSYSSPSCSSSCCLYTILSCSNKQEIINLYSQLLPFSHGAAPYISHEQATFCSQILFSNSFSYSAHLPPQFPLMSSYNQLLLFILVPYGPSLNHSPSDTREFMNLISFTPYDVY